MDHAKVFDLTQRLWYAVTPTSPGGAPHYPSNDQANSVTPRVAALKAALANLKHVEGIIEQELAGR